MIEAGPAAELAEADHLIACGHPLEDRGDYEAALLLYRKAAAAAPRYPRAHMNVGNALQRMQRWEEAVSSHLQAVACAPDYAPARFNLGSLLASRGDSGPAERQLREALRLQPDMVEAMIVLADLYEQKQWFQQAEKQYQCARKAAPNHSGAMFNYGMFCFRRNRLDDALALFRRAKEGDLIVDGIESSLLFPMNYRASLSGDEIAREHKRIGDAIGRSVGPPFTSWSNVVDPARPLRVGYVSGDFLHHPIALFLRPILEQHDRRQFECICYSNYPHANPFAQVLRERADHWREIAGFDDTQVAEQIRCDLVDVLVDLSGYTNRNRLYVFARHPAPVQATWLGYLNTTGLAAMDYRICDANTDPEGVSEHLYTERLVRMPYSQWCYAPWYQADIVSRPHPDRPSAIVFGSFNQFRKISNACLALWCGVLARVPEAELIVFDVQKATGAELLRRAAHHGIDPARVTVSDRVDVHSYFKAIGNVDIALDTFPYNGGTTTLDTLWMGVPLVALRGERSIGRGSYSILRSLGAHDLLAYSADEYVELNVRLARDDAWRENLRQTLRTWLESSPLMDSVGFTRSLEERYREMWRTWCQGR